MSIVEYNLFAKFGRISLIAISQISYFIKAYY